MEAPTPRAAAGPATDAQTASAQKQAASPSKSSSPLGCPFQRYQIRWHRSCKHGLNSITELDHCPRALLHRTWFMVQMYKLPAQPEARRCYRNSPCAIAPSLSPRSPLDIAKTLLKTCLVTDVCLLCPYSRNLDDAYPAQSTACYTGRALLTPAQPRALCPGTQLSGCAAERPRGHVLKQHICQQHGLRTRKPSTPAVHQGAQSSPRPHRCPQRSRTGTGGRRSWQAEGNHPHPTDEGCPQPLCQGCLTRHQHLKQLQQFLGQVLCPVL